MCEGVGGGGAGEFVRVVDVVMELARWVKGRKDERTGCTMNEDGRTSSGTTTQRVGEDGERWEMIAVVAVDWLSFRLAGQSTLSPASSLALAQKDTRKRQQKTRMKPKRVSLPAIFKTPRSDRPSSLLRIARVLTSHS